MVPAATDRPHFSEMAARAFQDHSGRRKSQVRPRRPAAYGLQPAAYLHLSAPDGRGRHLPDRQKLPHQRRDDREILRSPYQNPARRHRHQHHEAEDKKEEKARRKLRAKLTGTFRRPAMINSYTYSATRAWRNRQTLRT